MFHHLLVCSCIIFNMEFTGHRVDTAAWLFLLLCFCTNLIFLLIVRFIGRYCLLSVHVCYTVEVTGCKTWLPVFSSTGKKKNFLFLLNTFVMIACFGLFGHGLTKVEILSKQYSFYIPTKHIFLSVTGVYSPYCYLDWGLIVRDWDREKVQRPGRAAEA